MKKISIIFLSFVIFIAPPFAYAGVGKYIIDTVKATPNAVKVSATNTATGAKHVINHGVSSNAMAGAIGGGLVSMAVGGGVSLAFEVITGLALDAVDWMMDAENNELKWKEKGNFDPDYILNGYRVEGGSNKIVSSPLEACKTYAGSSATCSAITVDAGGTVRGCYQYSGESKHCGVPFGNRIGSFPPVNPNEYKKIPLPTLAQKTIDLSNGGNKTAQKTLEDYVKKIAERGDLDAELDASDDITKPDKECSAGYEKVGQICIKKPDLDKDKICPPDTIKVGDKCIDKPKKDDDDPTQCGDCCDELTAILLAMAKMNADFYNNSLDNDAQMLVNLKLVNDQLDAISTDFNQLLVEAKKANQTLTEINNNQTLHFNELKQKVDELKNAVETGNADILAKLGEVQAAIDLTNLKLDEVNLNLDKINDNLEKMQKCEETEFNKKICDFIDWVQGEPETPEVTETPEVLDVQAENSNKINMSGECPAPYELNFSVFGHQQNNSISYQPLCSALVLLKPIFIGSGALSGMFILMGYSRPSGTGSN